MKPKTYRPLAPPLKPDVVAVLLAGWTARAPEVSPHGFGGGLLDLFDVFAGRNSGIVRLWLTHEQFLRERARAWGWEPQYEIDGVPAYFGEYLAAGGNGRQRPKRRVKASCRADPPLLCWPISTASSSSRLTSRRSSIASWHCSPRADARSTVGTSRYSPCFAKRVPDWLSRAPLCGSDGGTRRRCSRRWSSENAGSISVMCRAGLGTRT